MNFLRRIVSWLRPPDAPSPADATDYDTQLEEAVRLLQQGPAGVQAWNALKKSGRLDPPPLEGDPDRFLAALQHALESGRDAGGGVRVVDLGDHMPKPAGGWDQVFRMVNTSEADTSGPSLPSLKLTGLDLTGADLSFCNVVGADFTGSVLDGANFTKANLTLAHLEGVRAHHAQFFSAYLSGTSLVDADLRHASFSRANLQDADLTNADLTEADLTMARLLRADLRDAVVERAVVMDVHVQELLNPPRPPSVLFLAPGRSQLRAEDTRRVFHSGWKTRLASRNVFVSYRRSDTKEAADQLCGALTPLLGEDRVFLDRRSIPAGAEDFETEIGEAIRHTTLLLLLIGERWDIARLHDEADHVRREIEQTITVGGTILPVLVGAAAMPAPGALPASLQPIARIQAAGPIDPGGSGEETRRVCELVQRMVGE